MKFWKLTSAAMLLVLSTGSNAAILYGAEYGGSGLYQIDSTDGSHTLVSSVSQYSPGLAYDGSSGIMYSNSTSGLYSINTATAESAFIGNFGTSLTGLTHSSDFSTLYSSSYSGLYSVDMDTGSSTLIGSFGSGISLIDLATDSNGIVYGSSTHGNLYTVNTSTGAATLLGGIFGLTGGPAGGYGVTALSFDENDILYGIHTIPDSLITIDINNLTYSTIGGDIGSDVRGMAFAIDVQAVPVPAAVWLFGSGLIGLAGIARRKKA